MRNGTGLLAGAPALREGPGRGSGFTESARQVCSDVDECNDGNNGGCDPNSVCTNTAVSRAPGARRDKRAHAPPQGSCRTAFVPRPGHPDVAHAGFKPGFRFLRWLVAGLLGFRVTTWKLGL